MTYFKRHYEESYSNLKYIYTFLKHIDEFEITRFDEERERQILFPIEINSMFGIMPIVDFMLLSVESLENLITKSDEENKFEIIFIGNENSYILLNEDGNQAKYFLMIRLD